MQNILFTEMYAGLCRNRHQKLAIFAGFTNKFYIMDDLHRLFNSEEVIKNALSIAICYCKEQIPLTDSWSRQGLESHLLEFEALQVKMNYGSRRFIMCC